MRYGENAWAGVKAARYWAPHPVQGMLLTVFAAKLPVGDVMRIFRRRNAV
jgi:hypothetical protein